MDRPAAAARTSIAAYSGSITIPTSFISYFNSFLNILLPSSAGKYFPEYMVDILAVLGNHLIALLVQDNMSFL